MIALATHSQPTFPPAIEQNPAALLTDVTSQFAALALDYIETAVFVLDADSRIHFASATAKRMLETSCLCARNGLLASPVGTETKALRHLVKQCAEAASSGSVPMTFFRLGDLEDAVCLGLVVAREPERHNADKRFLIVFASKPCEAALPDTQQLRSHFGLTDAQAKLAIEIAKGAGLKACARKLEIAVSTGRSHLKQIFEKTETRRQAELVRLISACRFSLPETAAAS